MNNQVVVAESYADLKGVGTEYVVINGQVIAKFIDGQLEKQEFGNLEVTK